MALVRAGLWEKEVRLLPYKKIDYNKVLRFAEEQSVTGLVAAGLEHVVDIRVPKVVLLTFAGKALQIEQQNVAMNHFIEGLFVKLQLEGVNALLVKGQGIAQCYQRPLWRACGDVDLLLDDENYTKAVRLLKPFASDCKHEGRYSRHLGLTINSWYIELQGTLRSGLSAKIDQMVDAVHEDTFKNGKIRVWRDGETNVFLPAPDSDVIFVFTHFLKHFFKVNGFCIRQLCDWCRLLWTYREPLNHELLESRIRKMGLMTEWKAFAALAVDYLGMPVGAMPLYDADKCWHKKAERILRLVLNKKGTTKPQTLINETRIFPNNSLKFIPGILFNVNGLKLKERLLGA